MSKQNIILLQKHILAYKVYNYVNEIVMNTSLCNIKTNKTSQICNNLTENM